MGLGNIDTSSGILEGLSQALLAKEQRKHDDAQEQRKSMFNLALAALPNVSDPNELKPLLDMALNGGKPTKKGKNGQPSPTDHIVSVMNLMGGGGSNTEENLAAGKPIATGTGQNPSTPVSPTAPATTGGGLLDSIHFQTAADRAKAATDLAGSEATARETAQNDAKIALAERLRKLDPSMSIQESFEKAGLKGFAPTRLSAPKALGKPLDAKELPTDALDTDGKPVDRTPGKLYQPTSVQQPDGSWDMRYVQTSVAPPRSRTLESRAAELAVLHPDKSPTEISIMAATELGNERRTALAEKKTRLNRYLQMTSSQLEKDAEALAYMKENAPLMLEARRIGIDLAKARKLTAEEFAKILTSNPESAVSGRPVDEIAEQLKNEGGLEPPTAKTPAKGGGGGATDNLTQLQTLNQQFAAATDPAKKEVIRKQVAALLAKIQGGK